MQCHAVVLGAAGTTRTFCQSQSMCVERVKKRKKPEEKRREKEDTTTKVSCPLGGDVTENMEQTKKKTIPGN